LRSIEGSLRRRSRVGGEGRGKTEEGRDLAGHHPAHLESSLFNLESRRSRAAAVPGLILRFVLLRERGSVAAL
jgi:hypothetical protein